MSPSLGTASDVLACSDYCSDASPLPLQILGDPPPSSLHVPLLSSPPLHETSRVSGSQLDFQSTVKVKC